MRNLTPIHYTKYTMNKGNARCPALKASHTVYTFFQSRPNCVWLQNFKSIHHLFFRPGLFLYENNCNEQQKSAAHCMLAKMSETICSSLFFLLFGDLAGFHCIHEHNKIATTTYRNTKKMEEKKNVQISNGLLYTLHTKRHYDRLSTFKLSHIN